LTPQAQEAPVIKNNKTGKGFPFINHFKGGMPPPPPKSFCNNKDATHDQGYINKNIYNNINNNKNYGNNNIAVLN